ncbi:MAG: class I SAM-dependent methyltransferase [bacterium]
MESREYDRLREHEDRHWWYRSLHALALDRLGNAKRVLDVGCGTGGLLAKMEDRDAFGVDVSPEALAHVRDRGLRRVMRGDACALPFASGRFDAVLALDLVYHRAVADDFAAVRECARVLRPGGILLLQAAAFPRLAGSHDRAVHGERRYTWGQVRSLVESAGLAVRELTYRNAAALPPALLLRTILEKRFAGIRRGRSSDLSLRSAAINSMLTAIGRLENALLRSLALPAGLSVWCVARKPG